MATGEFRPVVGFEWHLPALPLLFLGPPGFDIQQPAKRHAVGGIVMHAILGIQIESNTTESKLKILHVTCLVSRSCSETEIETSCA